MSLLKQIWAVTAMNIRALPQRAGTSAVTVIGVATVIAVMVSLLAIGVGLLQSINKNVRPDDAIVLTSGTAASFMGSISRTAAGIIADAPGVKKDAAGRPMVAPQTLVIVEVTKKNG